jgi:hypothetical protein
LACHSEPAPAKALGYAQIICRLRNPANSPSPPVCGGGEREYPQTILLRTRAALAPTAKPRRRRRGVRTGAGMLRPGGLSPHIPRRSAAAPRPPSDHTGAGRRRDGPNERAPALHHLRDNKRLQCTPAGDARVDRRVAPALARRDRSDRPFRWARPKNRPALTKSLQTRARQRRTNAIVRST